MNKTIIVVLASLLVVSCGGREGARGDQRDYDVVEEGSAAGVTSTIQGPGELLPPITATNADTTTAFTLNSDAFPPGTLAGTMPAPTSAGATAPPPLTSPSPVTPPPMTSSRPAPTQPQPRPVPTQPQPEPVDPEEPAPEPEPVPEEEPEQVDPPPTHTDTQEPPPPPPPVRR